MAGSDTGTTRVAKVLAMAIPPVAITIDWRGFVMNHQILALVLIGIYEILALAFFFAGKIATELWERWKERVVNRFAQVLGQPFFRFDKRYREFMLGELRFIELKSLARRGPYAPELDEVFVDVSLAFRDFDDDWPKGLVEGLSPEVTDRHSIDRFLDGQKPVVLAIIGVPGSGKTTLLRHTAQQICRDHRKRRRAVPILLNLRDHVTAITSARNAALPELVCGRLKWDGTEPKDWFEQRLNDGDCLVLLDGLDEVAQSEDRRSVASWVEHQVRRYPKNDFVITSRPHGYQSARIDFATVLQVCSYTDEQVTRFLQRWYLAVERYRSGVTDELVRQRAESAANDLLQRLNGAPALYELTINPLLLTMIAIVHRYGALPENRVDLYREICQAMLSGLQKSKNIKMTLEGNKKEALMRRLAFTMMQQQVRDLSSSDVLDAIGLELPRMSRNRQLTAREFLDDVVSNGLLIERESDLYSFAHQTFQEYLAASHILDEQLVNVLEASVSEVWWRETTLLYVARSNADPIVKKCLTVNNVTALSLAFDCAEQGRELAPELRDRLNDLLNTAYDSDTVPEHRRMIAGVLLTRHLRHTIRTRNGSHVCVLPISNGLYQLFQQDTHCPAPDRPTNGERKTDEPITGVRGSDAIAFVYWANGLTSSDSVYRLPTLAEIKDSAVHRAHITLTPEILPHSIWLVPDDVHNRSDLWTPDGADHPHRIDAATLVGHVKDDIEHSGTTLTQLLLLRSIIIIRVFARALARDHDLAVALATDLARDLARALARDRALTRAFASDLAGDLAGDLTRALTHTRDRDLDRALYLALDSALTRALDSDSARDLARGLTCAVERTLTLDLNLNLNLNLNLAIDLALTRALDHGLFLPDRDRVLDRGLEELCVHVMGSALAYAVARSLLRYTPTPDWPAMFAKEFADKTSITKSCLVVSPDSLAGKIHSGQQDLANLDRPLDGVASLPWAHQVAENLRETAVPIFTREQSLTRDTAIAIRLAALCLATEADTRGANQLGHTFREIAAGVTLLERRATGQAVPTETIMLAVT
jgi:NACHT domain-containing protein